MRQWGGHRFGRCYRLQGFSQWFTVSGGVSTCLVLPRDPRGVTACSIWLGEPGKQPVHYEWFELNEWGESGQYEFAQYHAILQVRTSLAVEPVSGGVTAYSHFPRVPPFQAVLPLDWFDRRGMGLLRTSQHA